MQHHGMEEPTSQLHNCGRTWRGSHGLHVRQWTHAEDVRLQAECGGIRCRCGCVMYASAPRPSSTASSPSAVPEPDRQAEVPMAPLEANPTPPQTVAERWALGVSLSVAEYRRPPLQLMQNKFCPISSSEDDTTSNAEDDEQHTDSFGGRQLNMKTGHVDAQRRKQAKRQSDHRKDGSVCLTEKHGKETIAEDQHRDDEGADTEAGQSLASARNPSLGIRDGSRERQEGDVSNGTASHVDHGVHGELSAAAAPPQPAPVCYEELTYFDISIEDLAAVSMHAARHRLMPPADIDARQRWTLALWRSMNEQRLL